MKNMKKAFQGFKKMSWFCILSGKNPIPRLKPGRTVIWVSPAEQVLPQWRCRPCFFWLSGFNKSATRQSNHYFLAHNGPRTPAALHEPFSSSFFGHFGHFENGHNLSSVESILGPRMRRRALDAHVISRRRSWLTLTKMVLGLCSTPFRNETILYTYGNVYTALCYKTQKMKVVVPKGVHHHY
jgi:hypothetical protein